MNTTRLKDLRKLKKELEDDLTLVLEELTPLEQELQEYMQTNELKAFNGYQLKTTRSLNKQVIEENYPELITIVETKKYPGVAKAPEDAIKLNIMIEEIK